VLCCDRHGIPEDRVFKSWEEAAAVPKFADAVIIATQDKLHCAPAVAFAGLGYHMLLEKPMAVTLEECCRIVEAVKAAGVMFAVGHVLRCGIDGTWQQHASQWRNGTAFQLIWA